MNIRILVRSNYRYEFTVGDIFANVISFKGLTEIE